ncbi:MAG: transcription elongation factor Spt5 [Candidatus Thermoplasmatota archaeon]|nr:transcription elongation factor Spt5 [Candidatus Thermoplasmatota archaeon]
MAQEQKSELFVVKTSIGHEKDVADAIANRAKRTANILAILSPVRLRGYVFVEATNLYELQSMIKGIAHVRGLVKGETNVREIEHLFVPKPISAGVSEGDIVEIIAGPFKGEKARIQRIDETKEEVTIELFEAMVPIPVTIKGTHVRLVEKK